ncbi:MAG: GIY-YIG nuclease family protein [Clostridiales bacterium]|nr:GIY-YIG nuclease family protein [Clostridiales bacterium]
MKQFYVYIATNFHNTVLYTGITNDVERRIYEHEHKTDADSFTARYNIKKVVYIEEFSYVYDAIAREKQIKGWRRAKKIALIESINPEWKDLLNEYI